MTTSAELERAISGPAFMYPWRLRDGREVPLAVAELESVHRTRSEMIESRVRAALAAAGPDATALDLACNEGWFSQRLLEWGAARVVGVDVRALNIQRATLLRDHFEIPAERLAFRQADLFDVDAASLGVHDVVFVLGLIYHVENPMGVLRLARRCTRPGGLCVVESQLTQQNEPIVHGNGRAAQFHRAEGSFAVVIEKGDNALASTGAVLSLVPNRVALAQMSNMAGFDHVEFATASVTRDHNVQYVDGDRAVIFAS
jgi:2-polyprenyl-3-methyl-5-hydroxy-6-metoxy-1,4-benzoquinol methylase